MVFQQHLIVGEGRGAQSKRGSPLLIFRAKAKEPGPKPRDSGDVFTTEDTEYAQRNDHEFSSPIPMKMNLRSLCVLCELCALCGEVVCARDSQGSPDFHHKKIMISHRENMPK